MAKKDKRVPEKALPNVERSKIPIHSSEALHSFLLSFAYFEDAGPVCSWSDDGLLFAEAMRYLGQRQRDPQAATGDDRDHYQRKKEKILAAANEWIASRPALQDSRDYLWSFRLSGVHRLWGLMVDGVFYVLWNDPHHEIYLIDVQERSKGKRR